jgi:hypothetical protein
MISHNKAAAVFASWRGVNRPADLSADVACPAANESAAGLYNRDSETAAGDIERLCRVGVGHDSPYAAWGAAGYAGIFYQADDHQIGKRTT